MHSGTHFSISASMIQVPETTSLPTASQTSPGQGHLSIAAHEDSERGPSKAKITIPFLTSFRIGGTREHLPQGTSLDPVEQTGHLQSNAFKVYLRKHAEGLGFHLQARSLLGTKLWHITEIVDGMKYVVMSLVRGHLLACIARTTFLARLASTLVLGASHNGGLPHTL
jgi:hypothetical protein